MSEFLKRKNCVHVEVPRRREGQSCNRIKRAAESRKQHAGIRDAATLLETLAGAQCPNEVLNLDFESFCGMTQSQSQLRHPNKRYPTDVIPCFRKADISKLLDRSSAKGSPIANYKSKAQWSVKRDVKMKLFIALKLARHALRQQKPWQRYTKRSAAVYWK
jgi:hypothetical protein